MNGEVPSRPARTGPIFGLLIVVFFTGFLLGRTAKTSPIPTIDKAVEQLSSSQNNADFSPLTNAWNLIQERYVGRPVDSKVLIRGAVDGLISSLNDPYSFYITAEDSAAFEDELNGKFEGIGAELGQRDNRIVVIAPLPGTPADRAGLRAGDALLAINGESTEGLTLQAAVSKIRGPEGSEVDLLVLTPGQPERSVKITREKISVSSVSVDFTERSGASVAHVEISSFTQTTESEFQEAVQAITLRRPVAIILDLRSNPGGYLDAAVAIADTFLSDGTILIEDFGSDQKNTISADANAPLAGYNVLVLVDGGTASAAEILAGALRDRLGARLIGTKTYGKGSVQEIEYLPDGSTVKLTIASWRTPNGTSIDATGLEPSITIETDTSATEDIQLERALELAFPE